jgi:AcrR family transcriptional regulator
MREEIQAYKRERILQEAVALFYARGFTATTLDDIAAELGVTKPFIYTHFRSKTELLAALCAPTIELSLAAVANAAKAPGTATDRLHRAVIDFTKVVLQRQANIARRSIWRRRRWPRSRRCVSGLTVCCRSCWPTASPPVSSRCTMSILPRWRSAA